MITEWSQEKVQTMIDSMLGYTYVVNAEGSILLSNDCQCNRANNVNETDCLKRFFDQIQIDKFMDFLRQKPASEPETEKIFSENLQTELHCRKEIIPYQNGENALFLYIENTTLRNQSTAKTNSSPNVTQAPGQNQNLSAKSQGDTALQSQLIASLVHDMKTPMNAIMGFTDLMLQETTNPSQRSNLEMIYKSGNFMLSLINDMLSLSRFAQEGIDIDIVPFSLERIINNVHSIAIILINRQQSKVQIHVDFPVECRTNIMGDPVRLQQVLNNLVNNSIKFTEKGSITIKVEKIVPTDDSTAMIKFTVKDTGIGIPEHVQQDVFEPYKQADEMISARYGGSGLGLAISKKIVELMKGTIQLESHVGRNSGTEITFTIPYIAASESDKDSFMSIEASNFPKIEYHKRDKTILVVEDNIINQTLTKRILEYAGFQVVLANEGRDALNNFNSNKSISLILMDRHMPVLDGLEAAKIIRDLEAINESERLPIIMLTGSDDRRGIEGELRENIDYLMKKPFRPKDLLEIIDRFL